MSGILGSGAYLVASAQAKVADAAATDSRLLSTINSLRSSTTTSASPLTSTSNPAAPATAPAVDLRVRISPVNPAFYGGSNSILAPLTATNGVQFPYSPQIQFEQTVNYAEVGSGMVHTNTDYFAYKNTPAITVNIVGKFTVQNQVEGLYALAVIHFFRTASKMYFGVKAGANAGLPPPVLRLNGYGDYMYKNIICILRSHSWAYNETMDTVQVSTNGGYVRLPAMFDLNVSLTVQVTPQKMRDEFDLDAFRTGALMRSGGWI